MKKTGILNTDLMHAIAEIGHTEYMVIADPGLPIPKGVQTIDISLIRNIPHFIDTLKAVSEELVIESYIIASEVKDRSADTYASICEILPDAAEVAVTHEEFKALLPKARVVIRTGETTPYSNIILIAGVNF